MLRLEATAARDAFADVVNKVAYGDDRIVIARRGRPVVAMISLRDLQLLELLEDHLDIEAARKALADPRNRRRIPWKKIKADLGL